MVASFQDDAQTPIEREREREKLCERVAGSRISFVVVNVLVLVDRHSNQYFDKRFCKTS